MTAVTTSSHGCPSPAADSFLPQTLSCRFRQDPDVTSTYARPPFHLHRDTLLLSHPETSATPLATSSTKLPATSLPTCVPVEDLDGHWTHHCKPASSHVFDRTSHHIYNSYGKRWEDTAEGPIQPPPPILATGNLCHGHPPSLLMTSVRRRETCDPRLALATRCRQAVDLSIK